MPGVQSDPTQPRFAICVPTYNRAELLDLCLWRIAQSFPQGARPWYEVIVSDNASTDRTPEVLEHWEGRPGMRVFRRQSNGGHVANMLNAVHQATAPLVVFLSDDDAMIPDQFGLYVQRMEADARLIALYADVSVYDDQNGTELHRYWRESREAVFEPNHPLELVDFVLGHRIHPEQGIYRREAILVAMTPWSYGGCVPFHHWMYRLSRQGAIAYCPQPYYRENYVLRAPFRRDYHCNLESGDAYIGDELRNVLEGVCQQAMTDAGLADHADLRARFDGMIRDWLLGRTQLHIARASGAKDWIKAVELQRRLCFWRGADHGRDYAAGLTLRAALQAVVQMWRAQSGAGRLTLRGFKTDAVESFLAKNYPEVLLGPPGRREFVLCRDGSAHEAGTNALRLDHLCECYRIGEGRVNVFEL
jgi:hypothetical protein